METLLSPRTDLRLKSPVIAASGTFGYGLEYAGRMNIEGLGALVCKGTTLLPRTGNEPLRLTETAAGMLNAVGLQNIGVDEVVRSKAPGWAKLNVPVFVNVSAASVDEYCAVVSRLHGVPGISGIELNISCPNVKNGGIAFGTDAGQARTVTEAVRRLTDLPLVVKLSPNVTDIRPIARAVEDAGADALSVMNTLYGMAIDTRTRAPVLSSVTGGLSGPAIKPLALHLVYAVTQEVAIPVIGLGGILTATDALQFIMAGASAVALGTALMLDPMCWCQITNDLDSWFQKEGIGEIGEIIGCANPDFNRRTGKVALAGSN